MYHARAFYIFCIGFGMFSASCGGSAATFVDGRRIVAETDGWHGLQLQGVPNKDIATVQVSGKEVLIERKRILLDGKPVAVIPAESTEVRIVYRQGTLQMLADGVEVYKSKL